MQQNPGAQINPNPNITAGFKNNIGPTLPSTPNQQMYQTPIQVPQQVQLPQTMTPVQQPLQMTQPQQPVPAQIFDAPNPDSVVDVFSIFGMEFQKKYVYIAILIILGIVAYFVWKWWYGPKKSKKNKKLQEDEESYSDEDDENNEDDDDVYIPPYSSKINSESKGNKKNDD